MDDKTGSEAPELSKAADPYGDVALGVECAWPQSFPLSEATSADEQA